MMFSFVVCVALVSGVDSAAQPVAPPVTSATVADLALHYRVDLYNTFRTQRAVYDRLSRAGQATLRVSQQIPADSPQQRQLASWFHSAHDAVLKGSAEIPAVPEIDPRTLAQVNPSAAVTTPTSAPPATPRGSASEQPAPPVHDTPAEIGPPRSLLGSLEQLISQGQTTLTGAMSSVRPASGTGSDEHRDADLTSDDPATVDTDVRDADARDSDSLDADALDTDALDTDALDTDDPPAGSSSAGAASTSKAAAPSVAERVDQLQRRRADLATQLAATEPLGFDQAVELLLRIRLLDTGRNALAIELAFAGNASQGDFVRDEGFTRDLFDSLRERITSDAFQGTEEQRRDLIAQIDGLLSDEDPAASL